MVRDGETVGQATYLTPRMPSLGGSRGVHDTHHPPVRASRQPHFRTFAILEYREAVDSRGGEHRERSVENGARAPPAAS